MGIIYNEDNKKFVIGAYRKENYREFHAYKTIFYYYIDGEPKKESAQSYKSLCRSQVKKDYVSIKMSCCTDALFLCFEKDKEQYIIYDKIIGFCMIQEFQNYVYIIAICAQKGCGSLLMNSILKYYEKPSKFDYICLESIAHAVLFYRKFNFQNRNFIEKKSLQHLDCVKEEDKKIEDLVKSIKDNHYYKPDGQVVKFLEYLIDKKLYLGEKFEKLPGSNGRYSWLKILNASYPMVRCL